jgi:hypothetical protein
MLDGFFSLWLFHHTLNLYSALGVGPGVEERRSIAIVVIGGQSLSLLLDCHAGGVFGFG